MDNSDRNSEFINSEGPNEEALEQGLVWLKELGDNYADKQNALLAVNTKSQLEGVFSSVVGEQVAKEVNNKNPVTLGDVKIELMTQRIDPKDWNGGPILALYPDKDLLDKIDSLHGVTDILVIPWLRDEVEFWIQTWGASELNGNTSGDKPSFDEPIVRQAVDTLDGLVNTSTGITHPLDRSKCVEIFEILYTERYDYDPMTVRAWLVTERGWDPGDADDVEEIAEGVQAGKNFQTERGGLADDIVDQWKQEVTD